MLKLLHFIFATSYGDDGGFYCRDLKSHWAALTRNQTRSVFAPYLSSEQHGSVIVLWVSLAWWIKVLLPGAKIPQSHASIAG